jgi:hypothetical protein
MKKKIRINRYRADGPNTMNGYKRMADFFPEYEYQPVLQACCSRKAHRVSKLMKQDYASFETDWKIRLPNDIEG